MAAPELVALNRAYALRGRALRTSLELYVLALWDAMPDKRDAAAASFVERAVPAVQGAQVQMATLTDAYLSRSEQIARGVPVVAAGVDPAVVTDLAMRGVPAEEVYLRPVETVWTELGAGRTFDAAAAAGRGRLTKTLQTDLQLAKTHAARYSAERRGSVSHFRRELTGSTNCGLCIVASTQRYHRGDLLDIHPGCDCGVSEVYDDVDPGQIIEPERLQDVHDAILETFGAASASAREIPGVIDPASGDLLKYRDVLVTHEHGEIGPVLGVRGHHFTSESDL